MISFRFAALTASVVVLGFFFNPTLHASGKPKGPTVVDHRTLIVSVDLAAQQVTLILQKNKQKRTYLVDSMCTVTTMGKPATIKDIKPGQEVYNYTERDAQSLENIDVGVARPPGYH